MSTYNEFRKLYKYLHLRDHELAFVRLGTNNLIQGANLTDYQIKNFTIHSNYCKHTKHNDIALIELTENVTFNEFIQPACLGQDTADVGSVVSVK